MPGKLGATDARVPPILSRLGLEPEYWVNLVENFDRRFRSDAGGVARLREEAGERADVAPGRRCCRGLRLRTARPLFPHSLAVIGLVR